MSNARVLPLALERAQREGFFDVRDPGASATISWGANAHAFVHVKTAGSEGRTLDSANKYAPGTTVLIDFAQGSGNLTITYNASPTVVLTALGQYALFVCCVSDSSTNPETHTWNLVGSSVTAGGTANVVTRATAAAGAGLIPVSNGADKALKAATPVALGTVDINTGDAPTDAAIIALVNALTAFGLTTATWT